MYNPDKIVITTILILLLLCAYAVSGAQACVDCDLNKKIFKKTELVLSNEVQKKSLTEGKVLYNNVREVKFGSACQMPDGQWIEKPDGLRADIDVESATKKNIYEINAYYMKWFPDERFQ